MLIRPLAMWPQFPFCLFPGSFFRVLPHALSLSFFPFSLYVGVCGCMSLGCPVCQGNMTGRKTPSNTFPASHYFSSIHVTCFMGLLYLEIGATISCKHPVCDAVKHIFKKTVGTVESEGEFCLCPPFSVLIHQWYVM